MPAPGRGVRCAGPRRSVTRGPAGLATCRRAIQDAAVTALVGCRGGDRSCRRGCGHWRLAAAGERHGARFGVALPGRRGPRRARDARLRLDAISLQRPVGDCWSIGFRGSDAHAATDGPAGRAGPNVGIDHRCAADASTATPDPGADALAAPKRNDLSGGDASGHADRLSGRLVDRGADTHADGGADAEPDERADGNRDERHHSIAGPDEVIQLTAAARP